MTITQLRYVAEIARCKSFSRAAERLYISQPSLSISVRKLEQEIGEPIFVRSSSGVTPTSFGHELLPFIKDIVSLYEQMPLQVYGKPSNKQLRISIANGGYRFFSEVAGRLFMAHKHDNIHIEFHDVTWEESLLMVTTGTAQIGGFGMWSYQNKTIRSRLIRTGIDFVPLGTCSTTATVGPLHPLWRREESWVTLDMIQHYPIIYSFSEHSNLLLKRLGLFNRGNLVTCKERAARGELLSHTDSISIGAYPLQVYEKANRYPQRRVFELRGNDYENEFGYIYNRSIALTQIGVEFVQALNDLATV